jgi:1-acyl-sn-glycerol-3-phosphate acyltransferase
MHKWKISGLDHIPREGAAVIAYHHGVIPVDYLYLVAMVYLEKGISSNW